jgi:SAM-dependent methyltransferase
MPQNSTTRRGRAIDGRTRDILTGAQIDGTHLRLTEQLPPDEYAPVKQILEALGGLWTRRHGALVFPAGTDVASLIADTLTAGYVPLPAQTLDGFVPTPHDLADDICGFPYTDLAWLPPGAPVLEPSAGSGALVNAALRANPGIAVTAVEPNPHRADAVRDGHGEVTVHADTFEEFAARAKAAGDRYAAAVMNPPFAVPGNPSMWIDHVRLAWDLLRPGARLVAVVPNSFNYRSDARHRAIRDLVAEHGGHERLPAAAFKQSGFGVLAYVVWMARPLDAVPDRFVWRAYTGAVQPVRVAAPRLTAEAVTGAPVQIWYDGWAGRDRTLRYRAQCATCGWLLWGFDDGQNDPRGVLGEFSAGFSLDPDQYGHRGHAVGLCSQCGNTAGPHFAGLARAETYWSTHPVGGELVAA